MSYIGKNKQVALYDAYTREQSDGNYAEISRSRKNYIINGGFDIWQRGEVFSGMASAFYTADRWSVRGKSSFGGTQLVERVTDTSAAFFGSPDYFKVNIQGATDFWYLKQNIESVKTLAGKTVTLSAKVYPDVSCRIRAAYLQNFGEGTGASSSVTFNSSYIDVAANQSSYIKFTFEIPPINSKIIDGQDHHLEIRFDIDTPSDGGYRFTQIQLEEGDVATNFEHRPIGEELALCQRYYQWFSHYQNSYAGSTSSGNIFTIQFNQVMRSTPSVDVAFSQQLGAATSGASVIDYINRDQVWASPGTVTGWYRLKTTLKLDAEL